MVIHTHEGAERSKPSARWSAEAARLVNEIGADQVGLRLSHWLTRLSWRVPRLRLGRFEADHGTVLRGLIWAAAGVPSLSASSLGSATREGLTKIRGWGALSIRVAHAAIAALATSGTTDAIAELLACKWLTTYNRSSELLEAKLAELAEARGSSPIELESFGRVESEPELDILVELVAAKAELAGSRERSALDRLLRVWRASKSAPVGELIASLGPRLATPIEEATEALTSERFSEVALALRSFDVDSLTAHFPASSSKRNADRTIELAGKARAKKLERISSGICAVQAVALFCLTKSATFRALLKSRYSAPLRKTK